MSRGLIVNVKIGQILLIALTAMIAPTMFAQEIEASDYTQQRVGEVHELNIAERTAIVSGYRYSFSGLQGYDRPVVRMYGSEFGSFEMLQPGMRIRVKYRLSENSRVVVEARQVANSTPLGVYNDPL
ncbi:MAG: hypothetical protein ACI82A_000458 [Candidatus Azotimanducaceae bacterium]|jgi:hypothetical protein